jgi:CO/xanthine dehydrogenase Mo-binding subunit
MTPAQEDRMAAPYNVIGKPGRRWDGEDKVTGAARYAADVHLPGTLFGKSLHSPYSHARIVRIDTSEAKKLPGVHALITGEDVRTGALWGRAVKDIPPLAYDRVRYFGERLAAVAADDEDIAQQAIDLIEVEYEELEPALDMFEAMQHGAPILHPDFNSYFGFRQKMDKPSNVYFTTHWEKGDIDAAFAEADVVIENTYTTQRQHHGYIEPQAVLVNIDKDDGRVHVWLCSKVPYNTRESLATAAGIPPETILMHHVYIGGDFGGKGNARNTPICYFLAKATGRPVRMVSDYVEELLAGNPRHDTVTRLKTGVKNDGTLVAHTVNYYVNSGAYAGFKPGGTIGGANQAAGPYKVPNCRIESAFVYTNNLPGGFMRGPGEPQGVWALESQLDEVARAIGMDPLEFRLKNLIEDGDEAANGEHLQAVRVKEALQAAADAAGYHGPKAPNVGRGMAIADRPPGAGVGTAEVTLNPDGSVVIGTPIYDQGTGTYTTLRQVVAEELHLSDADIDIEIWNTDALPFDSGVAGSRATRINSTVAYEAAQEVRRALFRRAAEVMGWPEDRLDLIGNEVRCTDPEETIAWPELLARTGVPVHGRAHIEDMEPSHITAFCAQVAEVEVDPETGQVTVRRITSAHDVGRILNPVGHQGQINGCVVSGLGYALMEELKVEDGRVTTLSFGDYKMPTVGDLPELTTVILESDQGAGPYAVRGIGEAPAAPVAPAIANAIADAAGVRIRNLPIAPEKVYRVITGR